jgi:glutathione-regulated potassium-efflux system protein KefB
VVILGLEEVGKLIGLMLEKADIPYIAFDRDYGVAVKSGRLGRDVFFGDMTRATTQEAAGLGKAATVYITTRDMNRAKGLAVTIHRLYPHLNVYVQVRTLADQEELVAKGISNAGTGFIESTLVRGSKLLKDIGVPEEDVRALVEELQQSDYALVRAEYVKA